MLLPEAHTKASKTKFGPRNAPVTGSIYPKDCYQYVLVKDTKHSITTTNHEYQQYNSKHHHFPRLLGWSFEIGSTSGLWGIPKFRFTSGKTQPDQDSRRHLSYTWNGINHRINVPCCAHSTFTPWTIHDISSVGAWTIYRRHHVIICKCSWFNNGPEGNELLCPRRTRQHDNLHCTGIPHCCWIYYHEPVQLQYLFVLPFNHQVQ